MFFIWSLTQTNASISDVTKVICNGTITIQSHAHNTFIVIYEFMSIELNEMTENVGVCDLNVKLNIKLCKNYE